jgi:cytoskeletal protein CcmA (bactofilin family)
LIGAGLRLNGNIACNGVLRIEGEILGDASCDAESGGTVLVVGAGSVCGVDTSAAHHRRRQGSRPTGFVGID